MDTSAKTDKIEMSDSKISELNIKEEEVESDGVILKISEESSSSSTSTKTEVNSVGKLQELCLKKRWKPPSFDKIDETGPSHNPSFTFKCTMEDVNMSEVGTGPNVRAAKRIAAEAILTSLAKRGLLDSNQEKKQSVESLPKAKQSESPIINQNSLLTAIVTKFWESCQEPDLLSNLIDDNENHYLKLEAFADRISCPLSCLNLPKEPASSEFKVFVALSSPSDPYFPLVSGCGSGNTRDEARKDAAQIVFGTVSKLVGK